MVLAADFITNLYQYYSLFRSHYVSFPDFYLEITQLHIFLQLSLYRGGAQPKSVK